MKTFFFLVFCFFGCASMFAQPNLRTDSYVRKAIKMDIPQQARVYIKSTEIHPLPEDSL